MRIFNVKLYRTKPLDGSEMTISFEVANVIANNVYSNTSAIATVIKKAMDDPANFMSFSDKIQSIEVTEKETEYVAMIKFKKITSKESFDLAVLSEKKETGFFVMEALPVYPVAIDENTTEITLAFPKILAYK